MLSRLTIISLTVAVFIIGNCSTVGSWNWDPKDVIDVALTKLSNLEIPFVNPKHKTVNSDDDFGQYFVAPGKKFLVMTFKKEFNVETRENGINCFEDEFLDKIAREYRDADVIKLMTDKCPDTASKYGLPNESKDVYFAVNFRLTKNDKYLNRGMTKIVENLLNELNPKRKEMTTIDIKESIDMIKADAKLYHLMITAEVEDYWKNLIPLSREQHITMKNAKGPVVIRKLTSISEYNGVGSLAKIKTQIIEVNSDMELNDALEHKDDELIVLFYTNNDNKEHDRNVKTFFKMLSNITTGLKIIKVNVIDDDSCKTSIKKFNITELPTLFFVKRGKMHANQVIGFDLDAIEAELSVLLSNIQLIDTDRDFVWELQHRSSELIIVSFTDNTLDENDIKMKQYLASVVNSPSGVKVVQVNTNSNSCELVKKALGIKSVPTLIFSRRNQLLMAQVHGFNSLAIDAEISTLISSSNIINSDSEFMKTLSNYSNKIIVMFVTDNSLSSCDCAMKENISIISKMLSDDNEVKVLHVNANSNKLPSTISALHITMVPVVLFMKKRSLQDTRIYGCNALALEAEVSILRSPITTVNDEDQLKYELVSLDNVGQENIILYFTFNRFDETDSLLRKFLSTTSSKNQNMQIIRVNADTEKFSNTVQKLKVEYYPSLAFYKNREFKKLLAGYNETDIKTAMTEFFVEF